MGVIACESRSYNKNLLLGLSSDEQCKPLREETNPSNRIYLQAIFILVSSHLYAVV